MIRSRVTSNPFRSIGYDAKTKTLEVEYKNGRRYHLSGVPSGVHYNLVNADSIGNHYNLNIRNKYKTQEMPPLRNTKAAYEEPEE